MSRAYKSRHDVEALRKSMLQLSASLTHRDQNRARNRYMADLYRNLR